MSYLGRVLLTLCRTVVAVVRLGRPLFLVGGFLLYALGAAVALATSGAGALDLRRYLTGQAAVTAFQLMTHYANDYFDLAADRANQTPTRWSGGSRVLVAGLLPPAVALTAALTLAAAGLAATGLLVLRSHGGALPALLLVAAFLLAWGYSAPPLRLHSTGLGELDTAVVVTVLVPLVAFALQAPALIGLRTLLLAVLPPALLQTAMLLAIEFPDARGDAAVGKRTLVVRLGPARGALLYGALTAAAFLVLPLLVATGLPPLVALAAALAAPLGAWRIGRVVRGDHTVPARWEALGFWAVALLVATAALELVAFLHLARPSR